MRNIWYSWSVRERGRERGREEGGNESGLEDGGTHIDSHLLVNS